MNKHLSPVETKKKIEIGTRYDTRMPIATKE